MATSQPKAFVVADGFGPESRTHPAMRYLEQLAQFFDSGDHSKIADYYQVDSTAKTPHAEHVAEDEHGSFEKVTEDWFSSRLRQFKHVPYYMVALDTPYGYETLLQAELFADVKGASGKVKQAKDKDGQEWDVKIAIFYHHELTRVADAPHEGLLCRHVTFIKDAGMVDALSSGK